MHSKLIVSFNGSIVKVEAEMTYFYRLNHVLTALHVQGQSTIQSLQSTIKAYLWFYGIELKY